MTMHARLETPKDFDDRRIAHRRLLRLSVAGAVRNSTGVDVFIHDLSRSGLLIETWTELAVGDQIEVDLPEAGMTVARVAWSTGRFFGCQFNSIIPAAAVSAAMLKNPFDRPADNAETESPATGAPESVGMLPPRTRMWVFIGLGLAAWLALLLPFVLL